MKTIVAPLGISGAILLMTGCAAQNQTLTSPQHPGPVTGQAIGTIGGVVAGNGVGLGVGLSEGLVRGAAAPFDNTRRVVRHWRTVTTKDGRTIQVPEDTLVDVQGRPIYAVP
jgi:hypothetical protein